jgi:hypothetical protein
MTRGHWLGFAVPSLSSPPGKSATVKERRYMATLHSEKVFRRQKKITFPRYLHCKIVNACV